MGIAQAVLFVFLAGLTLCGLSGTLLQIWTGERLGFSPPFLRRDRLIASLAMTVVAGPFMLLNDALRAREYGRMGNKELLAAGAVCIVWLLSLGVLLVEFVLLIGQIQFA